MSTHMMLISLLAGAPLLVVLRIYLLLPQTSQAAEARKADETCSLGVFLGSGGHTSEMRTLLSGLDFDRYTPRTYVYCPGDDMSLRTITGLETSKNSRSKAYTFVQLPRARRVGQPLLSTLKTSAVTLLAALYLFFLQPLISRPSEPWLDVLLVNGPGTCVLVVMTAWIRRILGLKHSKIIYVESFARVHSLSLSGKILRPFVDTFVVQWPTAGAGLATIPTPSRDFAWSPARKATKSDGGGLQTTAPRRKGVLYKGWLV